METKNIQEFLALAELGSSYAAAEKLFVSQSTLVRHIQAIENEFGIALFDRTRSGFVLNEAGKIFLPYAKKISLSQRQCYAALHKEEEEDTTIRIAAHGKIIDLIVDFKKKYPQYTLEYYHPEHADIKLLEELLDVAFISSSGLEEEEFVRFPFMKIQMLLLVYDSHPLASRDSVSLEELRDETFVALTEDITFSELCMQTFEDASFQPHITTTVPVGNDVITLVSEKTGIAFIHGIKENLPVRPGLKVLEISPDLTYEVDMCYCKNGKKTKGVQNFINFAKKWKIEHKNINLTFL